MVLRAGERISGINVKDVSCIQTLGKFAALVMETFRKKSPKGTRVNPVFLETLRACEKTCDGSISRRILNVSIGE